MPHETKAKGRAQRIPLDYYKKPDAILKAKLGLSALALVLAVGWFASGLEYRGGQVQTSSAGLLRYSKGPLASVHDAWNDKCDACHRPFAPIDGKRWGPPIFTMSRESDHTCQTCHKGSAHAQHEIQDEVKSCAGCHIDHRGRDVSLVRMEDSECTSCHADLGLHSIPFKSGEKPSVTALAIHSFATDHPPFSSEGPKAKDAGHLKFNHALHMNPGQVAKVGNKGAKTLAVLADKTTRDRYRGEGQTDESPIQLQCASCHVTDAVDYKAGHLDGLPQSAALPVRGSGKQILPITYENQCKACHPLTFDGANLDLAVPHRVQPKEINQFLRSTYAGLILQKDPKRPVKVTLPKPIPGSLPDSDELGMRAEVDKAVSAAEAYIYSGKSTCLECHEAQMSAKGRPETITPPNVPALWLTKSKFDHTAHRGVGCLDCHAAARSSEHATDILIPGIASCRECHAPKSPSGFFATSDKAPLGGVRHDCTTCHSYHDGDHPLNGRGALAENGTDERSFADFLRGTGNTRQTTKASLPR